MSGPPSPPEMALFICPHCEQVLKVAGAHIGRRGRCNRCGGRIALLGRPQPNRPLMATAVTDEVDRDGPGPPPTERQLDYARDLGATEAQLRGKCRDEVSDLIETLRAQRQQESPPTEKQLAYLQRLGVDEAAIAGLRSKAEASALLEALHLSPTREQLEQLRALGASGAQMARLRTRAAAESLLRELRGET